MIYRCRKLDDPTSERDVEASKEAFAADEYAATFVAMGGGDIVYVEVLVPPRPSLWLVRCQSGRRDGGLWRMFVTTPMEGPPPAAAQGEKPRAR